MTEFHARIKHITGESTPDIYNPDLGRIPSADFAVTRRHDGSALSRYGDLQWDRTPYQPDGRTFNLNFLFWDDKIPSSTQRDLVDEMHWLMFIMIYLRPGPGLSNQTLQAYATSMRSLARYCEENGFSIQELLSASERSVRYLEASREQKNFIALQVLLRELGPERVGFAVPSRDEIESLRSLARQYRSSLKQHPPIPTRILSLTMASVAELLTKFEGPFDAILSMAQDCLGDPLSGSSVSNQKKRRAELGLAADGMRDDFQTFLEKHGLSEFMSNSGYGIDRRGVSAVLIEIQFLVYLQVLSYSGMRGQEAQALPYDCLDEVERSGTKYYLIKGRVTKLSKGKIKRVQWVTSETASRAIEMARRIALLIYSLKGNPPRKGKSSPNHWHLFVSPTYLREYRKDRNTPSLMKVARFAAIKERIMPFIQQEDLDELSRIDPHRNWCAEDKFLVGRRWPLSSHQFRRSLALYAQRSGLVSLPSLKRQLQHITLHMSQYYAKGSGFATDFIGIGQGHRDRHFGEEWQETQPVSQYLAYASNVLLEDPTNLYGGHTHWLNVRFKSGDGLMLEDRAATLRKFQKGELAYKVTPVGGCVNPGPCNKNPIDVLHVDCVSENCKHLAGNLRKTERVVLIKSRELEVLRSTNRNLPELIHEEAEFEKLVAGYNLARAAQASPKGDR
jgi:integrase